MIALTGLVTLGGLTVLAVQGGIGAAGHERHRSTALYAAESGAAAAMEFLRTTVDPSAKWSAYVEPANASPQRPAGIFGNEARPGEPGNLFGADVNAWYAVEILNNLDDDGYAAGDDQDGRVIIRSTGYGPNGTVAQVEWQVGVEVTGAGGRPCPGYGQKGMAEDGAGRNDCLTTIVATDVATYTPGGSP
ncbi:MAG: hypothetical protein HS111_20700 [Kofleriaceae bacterium]|nr:hypothetical protein [Kofleriaceae bacterium]MCL4226651.1 hypothetical protein [Myxococcales bacterium]